jgi:hypothetical protein
MFKIKYGPAPMAVFDDLNLAICRVPNPLPGNLQIVK